MTSVSEVLTKAADIIEKQKRLHKWTWQSLDGSVCALGAIRTAVYGDVHVPVDLLMDSEKYDAAYDLAAKAQETAENFVGVMYLPLWNDRPERTQAEVVAALRKAAEL